MTTLTKAGLMAMVLVLASAVTVSAEPQRDGGHAGFAGARAGGARQAGFAAVRGAGGFHGSHVVVGRVGGRAIGRPVFHAGGVYAGPRFRAVRAFNGHFYVGGIYDPFWWPSAYPYGLFPFAYYPYGPYAYTQSVNADVKVKVTPKDTQVFVDGYYAGIADNFDGSFQQLQVTPGGHEITLYRDGYQTLTRNVYAAPDTTVTFKDVMTPLPRGQASEPPAPPQAPAVPPVPPPSSAR